MFPFQWSIFPKILQQIPKNGGKTCCFSRYFPNLWLSWYSMTSSQNVPISAKLSSLKFCNKFPRMRKKNPLLFQIFPNFWETEKYFPNLWFSWYPMTSSQNVPISVKLSSQWVSKKFPNMEKKSQLFPKIGYHSQFYPKMGKQKFFLWLCNVSSYLTKIMWYARVWPCGRDVFRTVGR